MCSEPHKGLDRLQQLSIVGDAGPMLHIELLEAEWLVRAGHGVCVVLWFDEMKPPWCQVAVGTGLEWDVWKMSHFLVLKVFYS